MLGGKEANKGTLAVSSAADWDCSPAGSDRSNIVWKHITHIIPIGDKGRNDLSIYCSPGRRLARLVAFTHPQDVVWASQEP